MNELLLYKFSQLRVTELTFPKLEKRNLMGFGVASTPASLIVQGLKGQNDEVFSLLSAIINSVYIIEHAAYLLNGSPNVGSSSEKKTGVMSNVLHLLLNKFQFISL